jgi:hypothetical protein
MAALAPTPELPARDRQVVELVGKFRQMTTGQIRDSLFADLASPTPLDRTLKRLLEQKHLTRLRRLVGGDQGGSGQFVYQLGRAGWRLLGKPGDYWAPRAVNLHTLAIADCYVTLLRGELEVIQFTTEPECHRVVGDVLLTPDAYVELGNRAERVKYSYFVEVDRGTEHLNTIREKCSRYWRAFQAWQRDFFPIALFVVPDSERQSAIKLVIENGPAESGSLFSVCPVGDLTEVPARG